MSADSSPETNPIEEEYASADAEVGKLAKDLEDLRQTLLRRQADFDNYRKRVEKERSEDSRRSTARVIESLIPVVDSFDQALASHREPEYANYRKGFELIHKQLLDNIAKLGAERIDPVGMTSIRICIRPWIARKQRTRMRGRFCRFFSRVTFFTGACCVPPWCA